MWILREPPVAARPRPSQQDLQHLTTPHDCHHLCVTFTAGSRTIIGCSCWWASGNQRNMRLCFCPDTMGMYRINPINAFFFSPSFFLLSLLSGIFLSFSKELRDGPNQNQSYLTISLLYFYLLEFYFNVRRCSEKESGCLMNIEWLSGWPFFLYSVFYWLSLISSQVWIIEAVAPRWQKRHFKNVILNNCVQTSSPGFLWEELLTYGDPVGPRSFNSSSNSTSSFLTIVAVSLLAPAFASNKLPYHLGVFEYRTL